VSEQLLNSTSAHYRLLSAVKLEVTKSSTNRATGNEINFLNLLFINHCGILPKLVWFVSNTCVYIVTLIDHQTGLIIVNTAMIAVTRNHCITVAAAVQAIATGPQSAVRPVPTWPGHFSANVNVDVTVDNKSEAEAVC